MTKRAVIFVVVAIIMNLLIAGSAAAQGSYAVPRNVPLERVTRRTFPSYFGRANRYPALIPEQFFPIGWSRDGKFAYYVEPVDEACGCYYAHLVIQDLRTDKVLWEFKYDQSDTMDEKGNMPPEDTIEKLWKKNAKLFSEKLRENGIVASNSVLLAKTFTSGGRSYTAKSAVKIGMNPDEDWKRVNIFTITLSSPRLGSKRLYSADNTDKDYWFVLDAGLVGVLKSPFENRVAVIAMEVKRGYEGPPHTGDVRIVGGDLTSGFARN